MTTPSARRRDVPRPPCCRHRTPRPPASRHAYTRLCAALSKASLVLAVVVLIIII